jgi:hypothetical protein
MDNDDTIGEAAAEAFTGWRADHERASCDACVDSYDSDVRAATPRIADSIARGDTKFFAEEAANCLAAYDDVACSAPYTDILIVCNKAYDGQQALGESCVGHFECGGPGGVDRLLCFEGCTSLFGYEDVLGAGVCSQGRPAGC